MKIVGDSIALAELKTMAEAGFGTLVKAVVDVRAGTMAVDGELHADQEALLLEHGSGDRDTPGAAMTTVHRELAAGRWFQLPLVEQMANIGSEIERTISWRGRNEKNSTTAFDRGLELLDLTIADPRHRRRLRELTRVREALADHFVFDDRYGTTDESWRRYFHAFTYAVAIRKGR